MIEESEKLKSGMESRAEHLADRLVPYTLAGTGLVWLLTQECDESADSSHGGFLLRVKAGHAYRGSFGDS